MSLPIPPDPTDSMEERERIATAMEAMVERFSRNFPKHNPSPNTAAPPGDVILLTGATGALGATLLGLLVPLPEVTRVYVLNRRSPTGVPLLQRQTEALTEAGFDPASVVKSQKVVLLETDLPKERLGLSQALYDEIRTSITHIIHNAYLVNFNVPLAGFEPNIRTARHLLDLALTSPHGKPPRFLLVSTADVFSQRPNLTGPVKEELTLARWATRTGYGQSKWVIEHTIHNAANKTPLEPIVVRVGQICGGRNGVWNSSEWVPAMIRSSTLLGCLPTLDNEISWIPATAVAKSMIEMRNSPFEFHHLEHPRPVHWNSIIRPISKALQLPLVPYKDWLARLEDSGRTLRTPADIAEAKHRNPAWTLIHLFRRVHVNRSEAPWRWSVGQAVLDMSHSLAVAPCLGKDNLPSLNEEDAVKWLLFWKRIGVLDWQIHAHL